MAETKAEIPIGIPEFFKGKSIFITGFTGFIGQLLVEKLLFSCPDLEQIYVLVRNRKGTDSQERGQKVINSRTFDRVREKNPDLPNNKITILPGDVNEERLGLSKDDEEILRSNVNIIIHGAASVRFDETLKDALQLNTRGTKSIVDFALTMPHLICLTYMSTAYCNCDQPLVKEELYPPKANWKHSLSVMEKIDPSVLQILHYKYIEGMPNTYTFTKHVSETLLDDYKHLLPLVIVRPSIVVCASREPECGWTGSKFGPGGIMMGYLSGLLRCNYMDVKKKPNCIFSDIVVNATLAATWKRVVLSKPDVNEDLLPIYNICEPHWYSVTNGEYGILYSKCEIKPRMIKDGMNFISTKFIASEWSYKINNLYRQVLPALIVDQLLKLFGKKPLLLRVRKTVFIASLMMSYFLKRTFFFNTDNFDKLVTDIIPEDRDAFGWDFTKCDIYNIYFHSYLDVKKTFMKLIYDDLETNRKRLSMLYILDRSCVYLTYLLGALILYLLGIPHIFLSAVARFFMLQ